MMAKDLAEMLEKCDGDIFSFVYKCGHGVKPSIMHNIAGSIETYSEWKNDTGELCIECWVMKKKNEKESDDKT